VAASGSADTIGLGSNVTYTVTVTDGGPADATQVVLTDWLSTGLTLVSSSTSQGACGPLERVGLVNQMICGLGTIPAGAAVTVTIVVTAVSERYVGFITNDAAVASDLGDPDLTNNSAHVVTMVVLPSLTVTKAGTGSGRVTSSPPGIDCGAVCSSPFPGGTSVTLTGTAAAGSVFDGWSGGGCGGTGTCTVDVSTEVAVTATFTSTAPTAGSGGGCGTSGAGSAMSLLGLAAVWYRRRSVGCSGASFRTDGHPRSQAEQATVRAR
jgi:uncharacterized repeat protein (TIGR01451 family)/uncharacterized protein (TIGR03382 family)